MNIISRRRFFGVLASSVVAVVIPLLNKFVRARFVLYGDGIHDDTVGLQAFFNGHEVFWIDGTPVGNIVSGHRFYITKTLYGTRTTGPIRHFNFNYILFSDLRHHTDLGILS